ncbi:MAG: hypothetical protein IT186_02980 [Acidobacteria bacterium]|nr:hypothetical protein [Acidobacteriota bacterium]
MTKPKDEPKPAEKKTSKLSIKKDKIKDLTVQSGKEGEVKGGGGGSPSKPRTPNDYTCSPC